MFFARAPRRSSLLHCCFAIGGLTNDEPTTAIIIQLISPGGVDDTFVNTYRSIAGEWVAGGRQS